MVAWVESVSPVWLGVIASLIAGSAAGVGALPVVFWRQPSRRTTDTLLAFAAGVMLAATAFSLLAPALEHARGGRLSGALSVAGGLLGGAALLAALNAALTHEHFV